MATAPRTSKDAPRKVHYPTSDGKPMAETQEHARVMMDLIETLTAGLPTTRWPTSGATS